MFFRLCIFVLWVTGGTLSLPWNLCLGVWRQWSLVGGWLIIVSCLEGFHFGRGTASEHRYGAITEAALLLLTDGHVCGVWVCVLLPSLGEAFGLVGEESWRWRGRRGGEMWREVSRGTADETPTPASCCLRWAHQQPAWLPVFSFCPVKAPQHPCPPADSSHCSKLSDLLPILHLDPQGKRKHTHTPHKQVWSKVSQGWCYVCVLLVRRFLRPEKSWVVGHSF